MVISVNRRACARLSIACLVVSQLGTAWAADPPRAVDPSPIAESRPRDPGPTMTLAELLAFADEHSPLLDVAERKRAYGKAATDAAAPLLLDNPRVQLGAGPRFRSDDWDYDLIASIEQPIALSGAAGKKRDVAEKVDQSTRAEVTATRFEVRRALTLAYRKTIVARRRADVARGVEGFELRLLDVSRQRLAAGDVSAIEVRIAEADAAEARQRTLSAEQKLRSARLMLAELSGHPLNAPPDVPAEPNQPKAVPSLDALLHEARAKHPELVHAKAVVAEAEARETLAESEAWPKLTVGVQFEREGAPLVSDLPAYTVLGLVGFELPVFQRNQAERGRANADRDVAEGREIALERSLEARIARARLELLSAKERLELQNSTISATLEQNLTLLRRGFEAGEISLMDVAVARERFLRAQEVALEAEDDYIGALSELETALGGELPTARNAAGGAQ